MACLGKNRCDMHFKKGDQACAGCHECGNDLDVGDAEYKAETAALEDLDASSIVKTGSVVYEADPEAESAISQDGFVVEGELG